MVLIDLRVADENRALWEALTNARKEAWRLARVIGVPFLLKFLLRRMGLPEIEAKAAQITGYPVQIILNPHAESAWMQTNRSKCAVCKGVLTTMKRMEQ
jgi:hypothetical protein